jgi:hypothetical protein
MIYIVDEDVAQLRPEESELKLRGYEVTFLRNADLAFDVLVSCENCHVDLVLIDVMLATNEDAAMSRYSREKTDNFLRTGLLLLADLVDQNKTVFPTKAVLFTCSAGKALLAAVKQASDQYRIPLLRKRDFNTAFEFADRVEDILRKVNGKGASHERN